MDVEGIERIPDFVRYPGSQQLDGVQSLRFNEIGFRPALAGDVPQHHQHTGLVFGLTGKRHNVEAQKPVLRIGHLNLVTYEPGPFPRIKMENAIPVDVPQVAGNRASANGFQRKTHKLLGGGIRIGELPVGVNDNDAFLNGLEDRLQQSAFLGEPQKMRVETLGIQLVQSFDQFVKKARFHPSSLCLWATSRLWRSAAEEGTCFRAFSIMRIASSTLPSSARSLARFSDAVSEYRVQGNARTRS